MSEELDLIDYESLRKRMRASFRGLHYENKLRKSAFFGDVAEDILESRADSFATRLLEMLDDYEGDKKLFVEEHIGIIIAMDSTFGPSSGWGVSEFIESIFYETSSTGAKKLNQDAQFLAEERWPLTFITAKIFEAFKEQSEVLDFTNFAYDYSEFILNEKNSSHLSRNEAKRLLRYLLTDDFEACYLFSAAYIEREFFRLRNARKVQYFRKITHQEYQKVSGEWRDFTLGGFVSSVQKHWGGANLPNEDFPDMTDEPTRNSLAHGIPTKRKTERKDALQMLLILQAVPFWLEALSEAYEELEIAPI